MHFYEKMGPLFRHSPHPSLLLSADKACDPAATSCHAGTGIILIPQKYLLSTSGPDSDSRKPGKTDQEGHAFKKTKANILDRGRRQHLLTFIRQTVCNQRKKNITHWPESVQGPSPRWALHVQLSSKEIDPNYILTDSHL